MKYTKSQFDIRNNSVKLGQTFMTIKKTCEMLVLMVFFILVQNNNFFSGEI